MLSAQKLKCPSSPTTAIEHAGPLTFDIPQGEVSIAGGCGGQGEEEAVSRLWLVPVHHANGVDQLVKEGQAAVKRGNRKQGGEKEKKK